MPLWIVLSLFIALIAIEQTILGWFYWLGARWMKVPNVSFRRALATSLCVAAANIAAYSAFVCLAGRLPSSGRSASALLAGAVFVVITAAIDLFVVARILRTRIGRAALIWLMTLVAGGGLGFGLAYSIRATWLEAYVSPVSSMAPTICGDHSNLVCANCGFAYAVGRSGPHEQERQDLRPTVCPNCGTSNPLAAGAVVHSGDRFQVDKLVSLHRWDIVAFYSPDDPKTSYIKRLVGLPGEEIALASGHVFANGKLVRRDLSSAVDLWRPTVDSLYPPTQISATHPHWKPAAGSNWRQLGQAWTCDSLDDDGGELALEGDIVDRLAYNSLFPAIRPALFIGDIRLDCTLESLSGEGTITFKWDFDRHRASAAIGVDGKVVLDVGVTGSVDRPAGPLKAEGTLATPLGAGQLITFAVRDGRAYICQNGRVAVSLDVGSENLADQNEQEVETACRIAIGANRCKLALSRILLSQQIGCRTAKENSMERTPEARILNRSMKLGSEEYFLLGDNAENSRDLRFFGPIKRSAVFGVARWIYWPIERWHEFQ